MQITISTWVNLDKTKKVTRSSYKTGEDYFSIHTMLEDTQNVTKEEAGKFINDNGLTFEDRMTIEIPITL